MMSNHVFMLNIPESNISCKVIFRAQEIESIIGDIANQANYAAVYSKSNVYKLNDNLQKFKNSR